MNEDNKVYMNQIWHQIHIQEKQAEIKKEKTAKQIIITLSSSIFMVLFTTCLLFRPELLEGISAIIGLMIISSVTFSEYKKLQGASYDF